MDTPSFRFLPLGSITPGGWLRDQLTIQIEGLTGNLESFWPDIKDSGWIGGSAEGWERGPYWLDGAVPLAYLLDDRRLIERVEHWAGYIIEHQHADGWIGPRHDPKYGYPDDPWPLFVAAKALVQYHEASGDPRVPVTLGKTFEAIDASMDRRPLERWAHSRWGDGALTALWLHRTTGYGRYLAVARKLEAQGFDWAGHFRRFPYTEKMKREACNLSSHVVNNAMALKYPAISGFLAGDVREGIESARGMIGILDEYHGQATGIFTGDEHLAGKSPSQGTELCAVAEYMYSLEHLAALSGDADFADRLELIAFNALPATFLPDMWSHQYDQQANQVICSVNEDRIYTTNGPDSNIFGLQPNFGCCTANMHQAWPKLASSAWMGTGGGGVAAVSYVPCTVRFEASGVPVTVRVETDYPFGEDIRILVETDRAAAFPLYLRIPGWTREPRLTVNGDAVTVPGTGTYIPLFREWVGTTEIVLTLPMPFRSESRYHGALALRRGPLLYSLPVAEEKTRINADVPGREVPHADYELRPDAPWNYALRSDGHGNIAVSSFEERGVGPLPFSVEGTPGSVKVRGRLVSGWEIEHNAAGPVPSSPVPEAGTRGEETEIVLVPYGCTNLRITEFPWYR